MSKHLPRPVAGDNWSAHISTQRICLGIDELHIQLKDFKIGIGVEGAGEKREEKGGVVTDAHGMPEEHL